MGGHALWLGKKIQQSDHPVADQTHKNHSVPYESVRPPHMANVGDIQFNLMQCLKDRDSLKKLADAGAQECTHVFSCNDFWANELQIEVYTNTFCFLNAYEKNTPHQMQDGIKHNYAAFLKSVVTPQWEMVMNSVAMKPKAGEGSAMMPKGVEGSFSQIDCSGEQSIQEQFECMMKQTRKLFEKKEAGELAFGQLALSGEQTAALKDQLHRLSSGLQLHQISMEKMRALEQGPGDADSLDFTAADDVPIPGPMESSLINPPSEYRYGQIHPGLHMEGRDLTEIDDNARCNDGTPAIYYMKEGSRKKFHLHLGGGYFCYNARNCRKRVRMSPMMGSSAGYERHFYGVGIFDPVNGGLPGWTHATFTYCSSDAFFGQMDTHEFQVVNNTYIKDRNGNKQTGTYFRGYTMTQAMLKKFVMMGLGFEKGQQLVISGCSAGSIAVTAQSDSFIDRIEKLFHENYGWKPGHIKKTFYPPKLTTVSDNMPIISPKPVTKNFNGELQLFDQAMELVKHLYVNPGLLDLAGEFLNKDCTAMYPENPAACVFPEQVLPHIQTQNLVLNNLQDTFLLFNPAAFFQPVDSEQEKFMYDTQAAMRKQILLNAPNQNQWAIGCNDHCFSLNGWWHRLTTPTSRHGLQAKTPKDMLMMTMKGDTGHIAMDECKTYNCGCVGQAQFYLAAGLSQIANQEKGNGKPAEAEAASQVSNAVVSSSVIPTDFQG